MLVFLPFKYELLTKLSSIETFLIKVNSTTLLDSAVFSTTIFSKPNNSPKIYVKINSITVFQYKFNF